MRGKRILILRPAGREHSMSRMLQSRGAQVISIPAVEVIPARPDLIPKTFDGYDWVVFTSVTGVQLAGGPCASTSARIAAIGPATADAARLAGASDVWLPPEYSTSSLSQHLPEPGSILTIRAQEADDDLERTLQARGFSVTRSDIYATIPVNRDRITSAVGLGVDAVALTSASIARSFAAAVPSPPPGTAICCIGPPTAKASLESGLRVDVVAKVHTTAGLADAIQEFLERKG